MRMKYDESILSECDRIIDDIKNILLELNDIGVSTMVSYSPMTKSCSEKKPKIIVEITTTYIPSMTNGKWIVNGKDVGKDVNETVEWLRRYVDKSTKYSYDDFVWESSASLRRIYQMRIST